MLKQLFTPASYNQIIKSKEVFKLNISIDKKHKTAVIIPAYKPSYELVELSRVLHDSGYRIIIVDDGSGSSFFNTFVKTSNSVLLHHRHNQGKGAALKTAMQHISENMPDIQCIVTIDADGQHLPGDMENVVKKSWENPGAMVLGVRNFEKNVPLRSRAGNKITRAVFYAVSHTDISDTQTGLRGFDRSLLDGLCAVPGTRYEYEMNVLLYCADHRIPVVEVPIATIYHDGKNSCSHFSTIKDSFRIYKNFIRFAMASFLSFMADYLLFMLFSFVLPAGFIAVSNIAARICSAAFNYTLNSKAVFCDKRPVTKTLPQYALLAAGILAANTLVLSFFTAITGLSPYISKVFTEIILFVSSFLVQAMVIYRKPSARQRKELETI